MRSLLFGFAILSVTSCSPAAASILLEFDSTSFSTNSPHTGASATVLLSFIDEGANVRISQAIDNTTGDVGLIFGAGATTSKLTGFGIDLPTGITFVTNSESLGTYFDTLILDAHASPFNPLDVAVADNSNYLGGNANSALPQDGGVDNTSFAVTGGGGAVATEAAFADAIANGLEAAVRFQQVNPGDGSDKLLYQPPVKPGGLSVVPEPASFIVWSLLGLVGLKGRRS